MGTRLKALDTQSATDHVQAKRGNPAVHHMESSYGGSVS
jgi:hypothetical protein